MNADAEHALDALNEAFLRQHPLPARRVLNQLSVADLLELLQGQPVADMVTLWDGLLPDMAIAVLQQLPEANVKQILKHGDPVHTSRVLVRLTPEQRQQMMALVDSARQRELSTLVQYPEDSAGSLMDPRFIPVYDTQTVREVLHRIRKLKPRFTRQLYIIGTDGQLQRMVEMHKLAFAEAGQKLSELSQSVPAMVDATATREEVVAQLDQHRITDLPVVDIAGRLIGIIRYDASDGGGTRRKQCRHAYHGGCQSRRTSPVARWFCGAQTSALVVNQSADGVPRCFCGWIIREYDCTVYRAGGAVTGGRWPVGKYRRPGTGGDHARAGTAGNWYQPVAARGP